MSFPYTPTGKLLRRKVAERTCQMLAGTQSPVEAASDPLLNLISEVTGEQFGKLKDDALLSENLRLDSLGRVQLQSALERRLGIELPDDAIAGATTLGELRVLVGLSPGVPAASDQFDGKGHLASQPGQVRRTRPSTDEHLYPRWPWAAPIRWLRIIFIEAIMRPLVWLLAAPRVALDATTFPEGPLLVIANHVSSYDGALVLYALPPKLRDRVAIAMSGELLLDFRKARRGPNFVLKALGPAAYLLMTALFNVFPLPRLRGFRHSFAHAGQAIDRGYSVLIFPEGHRSEDGRLHPFRQGIGLLASQSRVGVLPIALKGLGEMKQNKSRWFRSGNLTIHVGTAIPFDARIEAIELTKRLEKSIRDL